MNHYMREHLNIPAHEISTLREKYFLEYGTTMRGLQAKHNINTDEFLAYVHDLPLEDYITSNPTLHSIIASLPTRNLIFTNADIAHAHRVLTALELIELFPVIVDVNTVAPYCKPMPASFEIAMRIAGETDPSKCVMIDDIRRTTRAAREAGMFSILYNHSFTDGDADAHFTDWNELKNILESQSL